MANIDRRALKVQGDGRPFSMAPMSRPAILKYKDFAALLEAVQLDADIKLKLGRTLQEALSDQRGRQR